MGEVERLLSEPISSTEEPTAGRVPDREREGSIQLMDNCRAPTQKSCEENLGIGIRSKLEAVAL